MSAVHPATLALAALALLLGGASLYYGMRLATERERADALAARVAALESQLADSGPTGARAVAASSPAAAPPAQPAALAGAAASVDATATRPAGIPTGAGDPELRAFRERSYSRRLEQVRRVREDPEFRAALLAQFERASRRQSDGFEAQYGLSPAEANAFHAALARYQLRFQEIEPLPVGEHVLGSPERQSEMQKRLDAVATAANAELRSALGEERYAQWQQFQRESPARWEIREVREALAATASPLRPEQEQALVRALAKELAADMEWYRTEGERLAGPAGAPSPEQVAKLNQELLSRREVSSARLRDVASAVLAREQLARFDELRRQKLTLERAQLQSGAAAGAVVIGAAGAYAGALVPAED